MPTENGVFYSLGEWLRKQQGAAQKFAQSIPSAPTAGFEAASDFMRPDRPSLFNDLRAGYQGAPAYGQDVQIGGNAGPVEADGTPSLLKRPDSLLSDQALELEKALAGRAFEQPPPPATVEQSVAASQPSGHVRATIGGREYDYSNGRRGGAPLAGGTLGSAFGREWSNFPTDQTHEFAGEGNGSFSVMNELDPSMKTIGQLQDERGQADARPAIGSTIPGETAGEQRARAAQKAEADDRVSSALALERGKSGIRIEEQGIRAAAYQNAMDQEAAQYQQAVQAIQASALPDEEKARRVGEAQIRYDGAKQQIKESFGFGTGIGAAVRDYGSYQ